MGLPEAIENAHRRQLAVDSRRAAQLGQNVHEYRIARKVACEKWTTTIRALMDENGVLTDPVRVLPEILASVEESITKAARAEAKIVARAELQRLLRKVAAP
jgi:hypothetical protein